MSSTTQWNGLITRREEYALLGVGGQCYRYGSEVIERIAKLTPATVGANIYPILGGLVKKGLVEKFKPRGGGHYAYQLTDEGVEYLRERIARMTEALES